MAKHIIDRPSGSTIHAETRALLSMQGFFQDGDPDDWTPQEWDHYNFMREEWGRRNAR